LFAEVCPNQMNGCHPLQGKTPRFVMLLSFALLGVVFWATVGDLAWARFKSGNASSLRPGPMAVFADP
jgi:hypothetical protein